MLLQHKLKLFLFKKGMSFIYFVDVSHLSQRQNQSFKVAILFGKSLSKKYLNKVASTPNYVEAMKRNNEISKDEFHNTELYTDQVANELEAYLKIQKVNAFSQSEENILKNALYNLEDKSTPLPHKTIALMAGMGWIGKNNLLITPQYGCGISMCSVLCNAPLITQNTLPLKPQCDGCTTCYDACSPKAINGETWQYAMPRLDLIDVHHCTTCFQCVVQCPQTIKYAKTGIGK